MPFSSGINYVIISQINTKVTLRKKYYQKNSTIYLILSIFINTIY